MIETRYLTVQVGGFVLADVNLVLPTGRYGVLMGKTGSGKTTLLESLCGLRRVVTGEILFDGVDVTHLPPAQRGIGLVPQDGTLFPMMTAAEHLEFALRVRKWPADKRERRVKELAELLHIERLLERRPHELSGGERQRVALGRALSFKPTILCLDEPLSALDDDTRAEMILMLKRVQRETGVTALHVTHNRDEAKKLADVRIEVKSGEVIEYSADPSDLNMLLATSDDGGFSSENGPPVNQLPR